MSRHQTRREKLRRLLRKVEAEAILVTNEYNVAYLTGFTGDSSYLLLSKDTELILSDKRYTTQLEEECPDLAIEVRGPESKMPQMVGKAITAAKFASVAFEADTMTVAGHAAIAKELKSAELVATNGQVEQLRMIKDKEEIAQIRDSINCAERAFSVVTTAMQKGQTEKEVADAMEYQIRRFGGECTSFPPIVAVGPRAALPHARAGRAKIGESDFVLVDWGARLGGYASDLTRMVVTGKISPKLRKVYGVVSKAQQLAIDAIRHGVSMKQVDAAARSFIAKSGYGKHFGHGLGHGIGLQIHEAPRMGPTEDDKLAAGMVVTVEPGIYLPGWGGVRLEDDVLVTRNGAEVLTSCSKVLEECIVAG